MPAQFAQITEEESQAFETVVRRALKSKSLPFYNQSDIQGLRMDLQATHHTCPLDFAKLAAADEFTFAHDLGGIHSKLDRGTGELTDFFVPRCAKPQN